MTTRFEVELTAEAEDDLGAITDSRVRAKIEERLDNLETDPGFQGKPLRGALSGYRSVRAVGRRYRIIYEVVEEDASVVIIVIAIRKEGSRDDAYSIAQRRLP